MRVHLTATAAAAVRRGHPWVYRDGIAGGGENAVQRGERRRGERAPRAGGAAATGDVVELSAEGAPFLGRGLWDAESAIAVRVFQRTQAPPLDERALAERLERAFALRDGWFAGRDTTAYRLCNGEGDRVPSLVIDRYDRAAVVRLDGGMLAPWLDRLLPHLARALGARGVRSIGLRARASAAAASGDAEAKKLAHLHGPPLPDRLFVRETGVAMEVDLARGQKTGAFLDQRDNRARVRALAAGRRRVLNLFSYAGGFSVAAALGGAGRVTSVDSASAAHASAQRTFRENGVDPAAHDFVTADAFDFLEKAHARGDRYDLIICDPPSFAPSERAKPRALGAYRRLHTAVARVLDRGGLLCAASCSSHITAEDFLATLDDATLERDDLRVRAIHGQPEDHPTLPAWWEGRYLKFVVLE
ncbi:class I SAM-dependent rRNA methyltransferase [Sorangium sp. So ce233]|uniref:class I SAM-dependent rRNA methyltransferase n=1 Tax=Sorangium sp. So ce233 TaxID=3133290 RepID=UPI003F5F7296